LLAPLSCLVAVPALAQYAYLDDAEYDQARSFIEPLGRHLLPRVVLSETKSLPATAQAISKYDAVLVNAGQMSSALESAQQINPDLLVFKKFNAGGYLGYNVNSPCSDPLGVPFGSAAAATANCGFYAGHWLYYAGTTLSQSISAGATSFSVADGNRLTAGRYVVIYDAPAGSFRNAEHALVSGVSGNVVTLAGRGFKSTARSHPAGSIIAEHPVAGATDGAENNRHWMYNMSSVGPTDANGRRIYQVMADWLSANLMRDNRGNLVGLRVDGVIFDTDSWSFAWRDRIDVNNDLIPDGGWSSGNGTNFWGEGSEEFYRLVRDALPDKIVAGGARGVRGFNALNGTQMEGWPVSGAFSSANPRYDVVDEWLANYTVQLREGLLNTPAYTENLSKTPTRRYPRGTVPTPTSNAPFRFAFATTLLDDGYYAQEPRPDTRDPWWDEFAVDVVPGSSNYGSAVASNPNDETAIRQHRGWLGWPTGPRERVYDAAAFASNLSLIPSGGLDNNASLSGWQANNINLSFDVNQRMAGSGSMRVSNHLSYARLPSQAAARTPTVSLRAGVQYTLAFSARAQTLRSISVGAGGATNSFLIPDHWVRRVMTFTASSTGQSRISFNVGEENVPVWIDEVYLFEGNANVFRREFENGLVVVNATPTSRSVALGGQYFRIAGTGQDAINNGAAVSAVTIGAYDAAILVKPAPTATLPRLDIADVTIGEGAGEARFTVTRSPAVSAQSTVSYSTQNGTAVAGSDYLAVSGILTFSPGQSQATVSAPILDDTIVESTETFGLSLFNPSGAVIGRQPATASIVDNDGQLGGIPCGEPSFSASTQAGVFIWRDCADSIWHMRVSGGSSPDLLSYVGSIRSGQPLVSAEGVLLELPWDVVDLSDPQSVAFKLDVRSGGIDGVDFAFQSGEKACLTLDGPSGVQVFGGPSLLALPSSVDLVTGGACEAPPQGDVCGDPGFSSATDAGVFVYRTCEDPQTWSLRFSAGGQVNTYRGSLSASTWFSSMTGISQEDSDDLSPAPFSTSTAGPISFVQRVGANGFDGVDVTVPSGSRLCFNLESPDNAAVLVGANRVPVGLSLDPGTLGACTP
jgi:hypothetical protein